MIMNQQEQERSLRETLVERLQELVTAAFSLVAALAWNDAIQSLFKKFFGETASLYAKFSYAIFITLLTVWVVHRLTRIAKRLRPTIVVNEKKKE